MAKKNTQDKDLDTVDTTENTEGNESTGSETNDAKVHLEDEGSIFHAEGRGGKFNVRKDAGNYLVVNEDGDTVRVYSKDDEVDNPEQAAQQYATKLSKLRKDE